MRQPKMLRSTWRVPATEGRALRLGVRDEERDHFLPPVNSQSSLQPNAINWSGGIISGRRRYHQVAASRIAVTDDRHAQELGVARVLVLDVFERTPSGST